MINVIACIAFEHDLGLVLLAALICAIGALVSMHLLKKTLKTKTSARFAWGFLGAIAGGSTIWCTHFVAMLAYDAGLPVTYDFGPTVLSLVVAVIGCAFAFGFACEDFKGAPEMGGAVFGISISLMHYVGMTAFSTNATIAWDVPYVVASVVIAITAGALAFNRVNSLIGWRSMAVGSLLSVVAIVSLHFTGMAALKITPNYVLPTDFLVDDAKASIAFAVAGIAALVLGTGAVSYFLDGQARTYSDIRMRHLTDSAVDGICVTRNGLIVEANAEFARMTGKDTADLIGEPIHDYLVDENWLDKDKLHKGHVRSANGQNLPIELTIRTETITDETSPLTVYALRDISQRLEHEKQISFLARYDSLTGLRNRASILEHAEKLLHGPDTGLQHAVFAIDLDRFKEINDMHGHAAGDAILEAVGSRLNRLTSDECMASRIGGDEFLIIASFEEDVDLLEQGERFVRLISSEVQYQGLYINCGASIGVSVFPEDGEDFNALINNADLAMYRAKTSGGNQVRRYEKSMDDGVRAERRLIDELRAAIDENQLELHYQVQVRVPDESVSGYEALVRWVHPERGRIPPSEFIPLAEKTGLINKLGEWVLRTACAEAAKWSHEKPVSVNLSPAQLNDPGFTEMVQDILINSGLDPARLELEVTETCFVADQDRAIAALNTVRAMGVAVSIDDFGTGYSSLAMLQSFPFDKIKLDKSLIDEIGHTEKAQGVFRAIFSLSDALNVPILAEGVESAEQVAYLRAQGCHFIQGYYYGKPEREIAMEILQAHSQKISAA